MVVGDVYFIEDRIKEIDPALFITQRANGRYEIRRRGRNEYRNYLIKTYDKLHPQIITDLRRMDGWNKSIKRLVQDIEYQEYLEQKRREAEFDEMTRELAKDARRALQHDLGVA